MTAGGDPLNSAQRTTSEADKVALWNPGTEGNVKRENIVFIYPTAEQSGNGVSYRGRVNLSAALVRCNPDNDRIQGDGALDARAKDWPGGWA